MGLNALGLGFGFSAKDEGLLRYQREAIGGFRFMNEALVGLSHTTNKFTANGMELTTQLEAVRTQSDTTARRVLGNAGLVGKGSAELRRQAVSMAEGLNLSADATARAVVASQDAKEAFKALGLSARDVAKFEAMTGANAIEFGETFTRLRSELRLDDKQLKQMEETLVQSGSRLRDVGGQVTFLREMTKLLSRAQASGIKDIAGYGQEILKASAGFKAFTGSSGEATEFTRQLTEALIEGREGNSKLMAGLREDIPKVTEILAVEFQDIEKSFRRLEEGPEQFVNFFAEWGRRAKEVGGLTEANLRTLNARLSETMDPKFAAVLVNMVRKGAEGFAEFNGALKDMPKSVKEINKAFTTGYTLEDQMRLMEEQMIANFRRISSAGKDLVGQMRPAFKEFGEDLHKMAQDKGPVGAVVRKMAEMHQIGAMALVPKALRPMVSTFSQLTKRMLPALDAVQGLIGNFFSFGGILRTAGLALGFVTMRLAQNKAKLGDSEKAVKATAKEFGNYIRQGIEQVKMWLQMGPGLIDELKKIYFEVDDVLVGAWKEVWPLLEPHVKTIGTKIMDFFNSFIAGLTNKFSASDKNSDIANIGGSIGMFLREVLDRGIAFAKDHLGPVLKDLVGNIADEFGRAVRENPAAAAALGVIYGGIQGGLWGSAMGLAGVGGLYYHGGNVQEQDAADFSEMNRKRAQSLAGERRIKNAVQSYEQTQQQSFNAGDQGVISEAMYDFATASSNNNRITEENTRAIEENNRLLKNSSMPGDPVEYGSTRTSVSRNGLPR